mmetsp:Transcript_66631/g.130660  ORF Transcript_66631/g.130660 Transcript_66631/m.130660 type:complete len:296 (-) Transcript_66631:574-1461(-)
MQHRRGLPRRRGPRVRSRAQSLTCRQRGGENGRRAVVSHRALIRPTAALIAPAPSSSSSPTLNRSHWGRRCRGALCLCGRRSPPRRPTATAPSRRPWWWRRCRDRSGCRRTEGRESTCLWEKSGFCCCFGFFRCRRRRCGRRCLLDRRSQRVSWCCRWRSHSPNRCCGIGRQRGRRGSRSSSSGGGGSGGRGDDRGGSSGTGGSSDRGGSGGVGGRRGSSSLRARGFASRAKSGSSLPERSRWGAKHGRRRTKIVPAPTSNPNSNSCRSHRRVHRWPCGSGCGCGRVQGGERRSR